MLKRIEAGNYARLVCGQEHRRAPCIPRKNRSEDIEFFGSVNYRFLVKGCIPEPWSERLSGLNITGDSREQTQNQVTVLAGRVRDQAQLMGVLESLHHLHLPIISVTREAD